MSADKSKYNYATFRQNSFPIMSDAVVDYGKYVDNKSGIELAVSYCRHSNIAFFAECPDGDFYNEYYSASYWQTKTPNAKPVALSQKSKARFRRANDNIKRAGVTFPENINVLEVGSGNGYNLIEFRKHYGGNLYCVEPSLSGSENCRKIGIDVIGHHTSDLKEKEAFFDVIILIHVLEHFSKPWEEIQNIARSLKVGGQLIIEVPDLQSLKNIYLPHPFCWTVRGLYLLLNKLGFEIVSCRSSIDDKRLSPYISLVATYRGKEIDQIDAIPPSQSLAEIVETQKKLRPGKYQVRLHKLIERNLVTLKYLAGKLGLKF